MQAQRVSELTPEAVSWLWQWYLGLGKLSILDGDPGLGKSLIALDLCARLSTGRPMPDGSPGPGVCNSMILEAEDGQKDTVRPRLEALGADLNRVFVVRRGDLDELPRLPSQTEALEAVVAETKARLLVIDPVVAFLDAKVVLSSDASVRRALNPLADLAERQGCAVEMVRHLNKKGVRALYRGGGSIGFQGACRTSLLLAADPEAPELRRVLAQVKNNYAPLQPSLALEFRKREDNMPELAWLGEAAYTADVLLGKVIRTEDRSPRQQAKAFLEAFLRAGPRTTRDIWDAGVRQGLSTRTMQRAQVELDIRSKFVHEGGVVRTYWLLPGQELPGASEEDPNSLEPWLRPLIEKYPPPSPLDEAD